MRIFIAAALLSVVLPAVGACSKSSSSEPAPAASHAALHAAPNVKPGSHEDWCGEHEVPESQCTRCNPDLIPAFKATGDWCNEHGLPESQCKKCHPDLKIVRPPPGT
jgi:hypothetical protein